MKGSPSAGLVSPIWPSSLEVEIEVDIALNGENVVPSPNRSDSPDTEGTENIEHPKVITPERLSGNKRKPVSPIPPKFTAKRLKSTTYKIASRFASEDYCYQNTRTVEEFITPQKFVTA